MMPPCRMTEPKRASFPTCVHRFWLGAGGRRVILSPGEEITDPDRAEQLGLTVHARWLRCHGRATPGPPGCACRAPEGDPDD